MGEEFEEVETPQEEARSYGLLEILLGVGLLIAVAAIAFGVGSPGVLTAATAFTAMGVGMVVLAGISLLTLERVRRSFRNEAIEAEMRESEMRQMLDDKFAVMQTTLDDTRHKIGRAQGSLAGLEEQMANFVEEQESSHHRIDNQVKRIQARLSQDEKKIEEVRVMDEAFEKALKNENAPSLREIDEISEAYLAKLNQLGIHTTHDLLSQDARSLARRIKAYPGSVQSWQTVAQLMDVKGVGPQYAELLEASGIKSIKDLAKADPNQVIASVQSLAKDGEVKAPGVKRVREWVKAARAVS